VPSATYAQPTFARDDYGAATAARAIVVADLNRDSWLDVATAGARGAVRVLLNNGRAGGFRALPDRAIGGGPFDMATGDLNRDGIPDLVIANADANTADALLGVGDGTFTTGIRFSVTAGGVGGSPRGVMLADFNRDDNLDIAVTEYAANSWRLIFGDGNGSYTSILSFEGCPRRAQSARDRRRRLQPRWPSRRCDRERCDQRRDHLLGIAERQLLEKDGRGRQPHQCADAG
jgi:hypothetical protein